MNSALRIVCLVFIAFAFVSEGRKPSPFSFLAPPAVVKLNQSQVQSREQVKLKQQVWEIKEKILKIGGFLGDDHTITNYNERMEDESSPIVPVFFHPDSDERDWAYLNQFCWGTALIVPINLEIDVFTDGVQNCSFLMIYLVDKKNNPYLLMGHIYRMSVQAQVAHIVAELERRGLKPKEVVFSPREDTDYMGALSVLDNYFQEPVQLLLRDVNTISRGLVTDKGFVIGMTPLIGELYEFSQTWKERGSHLKKIRRRFYDPRKRVLQRVAGRLTNILKRFSLPWPNRHRSSIEFSL